MWNLTKPYWLNSKINTHEGWKIDDCIDEDLKMICKFLLPSVYPDKPNQVTIIVGSTIIASYTKLRKINWGYLNFKAMEKMVGITPTN